MRRNIFHDKTSTTYGNRESELLNDIFRRNFKLFQTEKWLVEFHSKHKLLHSDENAYVFFVKKETLKSSYEIRFIGKLCTLIFFP